MKLNGKTGRRSDFDRAFDAVNITLLILLTVICAYPIYYTICASFSEPDAVLSGKVFFWPVGFTLDSFKSILKYEAIWTGYRNTIFYTLFGTLYNLFLLIPASYALARTELRGRKAINLIFLFTMYFGGGQIPYYLNLKSLGLLNNPLVMIIPGAFSVYNMLIARSYFASFPKELIEASKIDGAGEFGIFCRIVLPLSGAIIAVMALYHAVGHWNNYFNALLYLSDREYFPLQMVLREVLLMNEAVSPDIGSMDPEAAADMLRRARLAETMKYSLIIVANLPVMIAYPFVQKYFVKGVMIGSVKG